MKDDHKGFKSSSSNADIRQLETIFRRLHERAIYRNSVRIRIADEGY
jgi:hypothetical protein